MYETYFVVGLIIVCIFILVLQRIWIIEEMNDHMVVKIIPNMKLAIIAYIFMYSLILNSLKWHLIVFAFLFIYVYCFLESLNMVQSCVCVMVGILFAIIIVYQYFRRIRQPQRKN